MSTIVVGYDGSPAANAAVAYALQRAGPQGRVFAVHAFEPPPDWRGAPGYQRVLDEHKQRGSALLDELRAETEGHEGAGLELELIAGPPAETITNVAETRQADEIVVGSRGFGRLRAALGSVSHEVLHRADRPVVVIPEGSAH